MPLPGIEDLSRQSACIRGAAAAEETTALLEGLLERVTDGVLAVDRRGCVLYWSAGLERLAGITATEARGRPLAELAGEAAARALADCPAEASLLWAAAGEAIPVRLVIAKVKGPAGSPLGRACAVTDLRRAWLQRARGERTHALATLGETVASVTHQLRNPLGATLGYLGLAIEEARASSAAPLLEKVREGLLEIDRRIGELLAYVRARPPQFGPVCLRTLLEEILEASRARFPEGPQWRTRIPDGLSVTADREQLRQAFENLVANGAEVAGAGGVVEVILQSCDGREGGGVRVLVRNTGGELSPADREKIFEPFVSSKRGGTGLGLPLARRIIAAHGGRIAALSAGGWTTFVVSLPRDPSVTQEEWSADAAETN
ncbi:MAG: PAS domain-containing protein [Candidatus Eisenbacteria sp.]|nr:PAS domain-containing protein [Candidatus Eisenbacteria bacterium]